jgi:hypothetical protein
MPGKVAAEAMTKPTETRMTTPANHFGIIDGCGGKPGILRLRAPSQAAPIIKKPTIIVMSDGNTMPNKLKSNGVSGTIIARTTAALARFAWPGR